MYVRWVVELLIEQATMWLEGKGTEMDDSTATMERLDLN